jgi:hypothetical protein
LRAARASINENFRKLCLGIVGMRFLSKRPAAIGTKAPYLGFIKPALLARGCVTSSDAAQRRSKDHPGFCTGTQRYR